jgi:hypothetical protein
MRRWIVATGAVLGVAGLALPAYANVAVPAKHGKPVTSADCKKGGGTVMMGKCKGGTYDGDTVSG